MEERAIIRLLVFAVMIGLSLSAVVSADPTGPGVLNAGPSQRSDAIGKDAKQVAAEAGNVTELDIDANIITKTWQGYYGNISGVITLDDAQNKTMYNWIDANPQGEIFSTNSTSVSWADVFCFNMDPDLPNEGNLTTFESYIGVPGSAMDGINETFKTKDHSAFQIGSRTINADSCWSVKTYVNDAVQASSNFIEVMLVDNDSREAVFATILNNSVTGFDAKPHDFQMLVPVAGGHAIPATLDTFYFYVELE
ncbi:MAG: hypothetical protein V1837_02690 [Candidatus Woesearchaeota archaeon]